MSAPGFSPFAGVGGGGGGSDGAAVLGWGASSVASSVTTRYLYPWYEQAVAPTAPFQWRAPRAGTLQNMRVRQNTPGGNGNAIVYTFRVNNVATALSVSMASTATDGSDLASTVAVAAGDLIDVEVTKAVGVNPGSPTNIALAVEFTN